MNPLDRKYLAEFHFSRQFIDSCISRVGKSFDINKSFDQYNDKNGCYLFSFEAIEDLNRRLDEAKENFKRQEIDLEDYVKGTIKRQYGHEN